MVLGGQNEMYWAHEKKSWYGGLMGKGVFQSQL